MQRPPKTCLFACKNSGKHAAYCCVAPGQIVLSLQNVITLKKIHILHFYSPLLLSLCGCVYTYTCQVLHCAMTSVHAIEPERVLKGAVDRKPLKCFPICRADRADPDSQTPHTTLINILPSPPRALHFLLLPQHPFFSSLCWLLMSRSRHRAGSLMISPSSSCLPLLNFVKLSPRRTFLLCPPAAYQRPGSPAPPPACLCRPGWTRAGRFSAGPEGL